MKKFLSNYWRTILQFIVMALCAWWSYNQVAYGQEFPKPTGYVSDFADVLTVGEEKTLEAILRDYEAKSTVEIAVVTIKSLDGETIEEYTNKLAIEWGVGKKNKDNGLVILNSIEDRKWRIEVGYGLEEFITDIYSGNIGDNYLTPNLKEGKYFEAYKSTVEQVMKRLGNLTDEDKQRMKEEDEEGWPLWLIILLIVVGTLVLFIIIGIASEGGGGGGTYWSSGGGSSSGGGGFGGGSFGGGGASGGY